MSNRGAVFVPPVGHPDYVEPQAAHSAPAPGADPQQSLLRWGIENSTPGSLLPLHEDMKAGRRPDLNTDILKAIMGTTDADRMKECAMVIDGRWVDRREEKDKREQLQELTVTRADKLRAWDDLEMLIEDLDNANDLKFLKLWTPIIQHLTDEDEEVAMRSCWVCGTAVQNNPRAQDAFLEHDPLPILISILLSRTLQPSTRNKAMYALSSTLKHSEKAVARFEALDGWSVLNSTLQDPSQVLRTKSAFLLSQLVLQIPSASALSSFRSSAILPTLLASLSPSSAVPTGPDGDEEIDVDYREKAVRVLVGIVERLREAQAATTEPLDELTASEKAEMEQLVKMLEGTKGWKEDDVGLAVEEWAAFKAELAEA